MPHLNESYVSVSTLDPWHNNLPQNKNRYTIPVQLAGPTLKPKSNLSIDAQKRLILMKQQLYNARQAQFNLM
jgi:hypothetical protein